MNEGLDYYVFSKSFDFPYEVSDLIFLSSENYCFLNSPESVKEDILGLGIDNIVLENCSPSDERVCFGGGTDCDVFVYGSCSGSCDSIYDEGVVSKKDGDFVYIGDLIYAAIFSDKEVYECNIKRLIYRAKNIADIFIEKSDLMDARNCNTNLKTDLIAWRGMLENSSSEDLTFLKGFAEDLDRKNNREVCGLW